MNTEDCNDWRARRNEEQRKGKRARLFVMGTFFVAGFAAAVLFVGFLEAVRAIASVWAPL